MTQAYDPKDCPMPLDFFLRRYGISRTTAWRWRKNGLPTLQVGAKIFCRESEFVRFMETQTVNRQRFAAHKINPQAHQIPARRRGPMARRTPNPPGLKPR